MLKNPVLLVGAALAAAVLAWLIAGRLDRSNDMEPLQPPPGESLRHQGAVPKPTRVEPAEALKKLTQGGTLPAGDAVLRELLQKELDARADPSYRVMVDVPFEDNAAPQIKDELKDWLARKMAGLGFAEATAKPTLMFIVHIDPGPEGRYVIHLALRAGGETRLDQKLNLPAAYNPERMDQAFAGAFAPAPPRPQSEKKP